MIIQFVVLSCQKNGCRCDSRLCNIFLCSEKLFVKSCSFDNCGKRKSEDNQHSELAESDTAALIQEVGEVEAHTADKEEVDFEADDYAVEDCGHKYADDWQILDTNISKRVHRERREKRSNGTENHIVEAETCGNRADVRDNAAERETWNRGVREERENGHNLSHSELNRHRRRAGQQHVLQNCHRRVKRGNYCALNNVERGFVFHI